eukprot:g11364.t1
MVMDPWYVLEQDYKVSWGEDDDEDDEKEDQSESEKEDVEDEEAAVHEKQKSEMLRKLYGDKSKQFFRDYAAESDVVHGSVLHLLVLLQPAHVLEQILKDEVLSSLLVTKEALVDLGDDQDHDDDDDDDDAEQSEADYGEGDSDSSDAGDDEHDTDEKEDVATKLDASWQRKSYVLTPTPYEGPNMYKLARRWTVPMSPGASLIRRRLAARGGQAAMLTALYRFCTPRASVTICEPLLRKAIWFLNADIPPVPAKLKQDLDNDDPRAYPPWTRAEHEKLERNLHARSQLFLDVGAPSAGSAHLKLWNIFMRAAVLAPFPDFYVKQCLFDGTRLCAWEDSQEETIKLPLPHPFLRTPAILYNVAKELKKAGKLGPVEIREDTDPASLELQQEDSLCQCSSASALGRCFTEMVSGLLQFTSDEMVNVMWGEPRPGAGSDDHDSDADDERNVNLLTKCFDLSLPTSVAMLLVKRVDNISMEDNYRGAELLGEALVYCTKKMTSNFGADVEYGCTSQLSEEKRLAHQVFVQGLWRHPSLSETTKQYFREALVKGAPLPILFTEVFGNSSCATFFMVSGRVL